MDQHALVAAGMTFCQRPLLPYLYFFCIYFFCLCLYFSIQAFSITSADKQDTAARASHCQPTLPYEHPSQEGITPGKPVEELS